MGRKMISTTSGIRNMEAVMQTGEREIEIRELDKPTPSKDEVLIKVSHAGVCGSDLHAYLHPDSDRVKVPRIMGHEYTGKIVEVGRDVSSLEVGTCVVEKPIHTCGRCHQCKTGQENLCHQTVLRGLETDGGFAEYVAVHEDFVHIVPDSIPSRHAAIIEPLSVCVRSIFNRSNILSGDSAIVQGPGPIGSLTALVLDSLGIDVIVTGLKDDSEYRLPILESTGIRTVDIQSEDVSESVYEITGGDVVDGVFDATGNKNGVESAIEYTRKGGDVVILGLPSRASEVFVTNLVRGEIDILPSYSATWEDFERANRLLTTYPLALDAIIDPQYDIRGAKNAFEDSIEKATCKAVISFT